MGSYGIGVERIIACYIEQNYDEKGIIWEKPLAPFDIHLIGLNMKNENISAVCENLYIELQKANFEVLFDDRSEVSAGFKFNDADLLGMPVQVIIGEKNLKENLAEIKIRRTGEKFKVSIDELTLKLKDLIK
jgi:prolyl-tRNA synthetase